MWKEAAMSFSDSLTVSLLGLSVVFLMLLILLIAILVISWIVRTVMRKTGSVSMQTPGDTADAAETMETAEMMAVLMAVLSQETGIAPRNLEIRSITEIGESNAGGKETG